jgi:hypothetical protein
MTMHIEPTPPTLPPPALPVMCGQYPDELATHAYVWAWGESGVCCPRGVASLRQTADQIGRTIEFSVLNPGLEPPLERTERVRLKAEVYAAEAELSDAKARGLELYRQNTLLAQQAQAATVRGRESEAQLSDATARVATLTGQLASRDAEHGDLVDEIERLKLIAGTVDAALDRTTELERENAELGRQNAALSRQGDMLAADVRRLTAELADFEDDDGDNGETTLTGGG